MGFQTKECDLPTWWLDVEDFDCDIVRTAGPGNPPSNIFHPGETIDMRFKWTQVGGFFAFPPPAGTHWHLRVYLEQYGGGEYAGGPISSFPLVVGPSGFQNSQDVRISGTGAPGEPLPLPAGVYKIIVTLSLVNPPDTMTLFHAYEEAGVIEVVQVGPVVP